MKHNLQFKSFKIANVQEESGTMTIEGWGAVFGNIDSTNDVIVKGAFAKTLMERKDRIAFAYQHDIWNPIGKILDIKEDNTGLYVKVMLSAAEEDIQCKVKEGILKEMSIGYRAINSTSGVQDGQDVQYLNEIMLYEVSLVTIASNPLAVITRMKAEEKADFIDTEFERLIAIERNQAKRFDLMKLKSQVEALINESQVETLKEEEPIIETVITPIEEPFTKSDILKLLS
jgi:HK97 family phage prohead protease